MKKIYLLLITLISISKIILAQNVGYYNGTDGLSGTQLKAALHEKIKNHTSFSYDRAKQILLKSDADPNIPGNVILIYTGRSADGTDYGTGANQLNREHVWAKSHGDFGTTQPTGTDCHNLRPIDMSVNTTRSNKDFDNCPGGTQDAEATECYYTSDAWEPRDAVKGDVARIIFYMATRYEGENGEVDLEPADYVNTYPNPLHGKLSTLLAWNNADPPDSFEINRNNVIFNWQKNRNPFIDNPEFANLIWNGATPSPIVFDSIYISPQNPTPNDTIKIYAKIHSPYSPITANITWGTSYFDLSNTISTTENNNIFLGKINPQPANSNIYFKINANDGTNNHSSIIYKIFIRDVYLGGIVKIYDIQGQTSTSPYNGQYVTTSGIVTANFGDGYFIQDGSGEWNGIYVYDSERNPTIGDSIVIHGQVYEFYDFTEIKNVSSYYFCSSNNDLPNPVTIATSNIGEAYEGVLVKVTGAICTNTNAGYDMWKVNDGSGECNIRNTELYSFTPTLNSNYTIRGIVNYDYSEYKIDLTSYFDVSATVSGISNVSALNSTTVNVLFTKEVETNSSQNINNYTISGGISVQSAVQNQNQKRLVTLTVSPLSTGYYTLTVNNVQDTDGVTLTNESFNFYFDNTAININKNDNNKIYPNPATNILYIDLNNNNKDFKDIYFYDVFGQVVKHLKFKNPRFKINIADLQKGLYFIKIQSNKNTYTKKIIKE